MVNGNIFKINGKGLIMKFVLSNSMNEEQVLTILNEFSRLSQKRTPCYLAMDNDHPLNS